MKRAFLLVLLGSAIVFPAGVAQALGPGELPSTWHVHDCTPLNPDPMARPPCVLPHQPVSFFPTILTGGDVLTYLGDPARCPDATDKSFLGGGAPGGGSREPNQPLRDGVCMTSTTVIHLKSIADDQPAPSGWTFLSSTGGFSTYYRLTSV
jgi:hypothetical protein